MKLDADIIIVGSGIGGATIAKELAKRKKKILILERGSFYHPNQIGSELCAYKFYDRHGLWSKTKEGIFYYRALMVGGTSVVSCGNGTRSLEKEFKKLGMDLTKEFIEVEKELNIKPISGRLIGKGTKKIMQAADKLGFKMEPMPKYINIRKCDACGNCVLGCQSEAKWTALQYLTQAQENGVSLLTGINVTKVLVSKRRAIGLQGFNQAGKRIEKFANIIVLAAGGIGTPIILQNSKIKAGDKLFLDLFNVTIGLTKDKGLTKEPVMAAVHHNRGFVLSPFIDTPLVLASVVPLSLRRNIKISTQRDHLLGIMVKIKDDCRGRVNKDGSIEKTITPKDLFKLNKGTSISRKILINAKVDPKTIVTTRIRGAHPGGTAAIGQVVNKNLETRIKGLFVCDASVLPTAPGLPPVVTIIALAKKFAKQLAGIKEKCRVAA